MRRASPGIGGVPACLICLFLQRCSIAISRAPLSEVLQDLGDSRSRCRSQHLKSRRSCNCSKLSLANLAGLSLLSRMGAFAAVCRATRPTCRLPRGSCWAVTQRANGCESQSDATGGCRGRPDARAPGPRQGILCGLWRRPCAAMVSPIDIHAAWHQDSRDLISIPGRTRCEPMSLILCHFRRGQDQVTNRWPSSQLVGGEDFCLRQAPVSHEELAKHGRPIYPFAHPVEDCRVLRSEPRSNEEELAPYCRSSWQAVQSWRAFFSVWHAMQERMSCVTSFLITSRWGTGPWQVSQVVPAVVCTRWLK